MNKYLKMNDSNWLKLCKKKIKAEQQSIDLKEKTEQLSLFEKIERSFNNVSKV